MSNSNRSRRKSAPLIFSGKKGSNLQMFKLLDPLLQSALFIFFIFSLDTQTHFPYRYILMFLICWQILSAAINLMFYKQKQLLAERISFLVAILVYGAYFLYAFRPAHENSPAIQASLPATGSTSTLVLLSVGLLLAFWYNILCYREFKSSFGKINRGNGR
jgi:hypothetical protein